MRSAECVALMAALVEALPATFEALSTMRETTKALNSTSREKAARMPAPIAYATSTLRARGFDETTVRLAVDVAYWWHRGDRKRRPRRGKA